MSKTTKTYWNPLNLENSSKWEIIENSKGMLEELTLAIDEKSGEYTRLMRSKPGADTASFGANSHDHPEEIFFEKGRLYDAAFDKWLETGEYASRPSGEVHGPFKADQECIVLEVSYPSQAIG